MRQGTLGPETALVRLKLPLPAAALLIACVCAAPGQAQEAPAAGSHDESSYGAAWPPISQALTAMEALREEIATLRALGDAQQALLAWNRESARSGAAPQALPAVLCEDPAIAAWCALLPATFGAAATEESDD